MQAVFLLFFYEKCFIRRDIEMGGGGGIAISEYYFSCKSYQKNAFIREISSKICRLFFGVSF